MPYKGPPTAPAVRPQVVVPHDRPFAVCTVLHVMHSLDDGTWIIDIYLHVGKLQGLSRNHGTGFRPPKSDRTEPCSPKSQ